VFSSLAFSALYDHCCLDYSPRNPVRNMALLREEASSPFDRNSLSDKENQALPCDTSRSDKRKNRGEAMASSSAHGPVLGSSATKRRRLAESSLNLGRPSQDARSQQPSDKDFYDPDQDENERRRIRKELRDLTQDLRGKFPVFISRFYISCFHRLPRGVSSSRKPWHCRYLTKSERDFRSR
jgi:hypothetical protein